MKIFNAVDLICGVNCEGNSVEAFAADDAAEATRVIWLACCTQYSVQNWQMALAALLQSVCIVSLTQRLAIDSVEGQSLQLQSTLAAREAVDVVKPTHGTAT